MADFGAETELTEDLGVACSASVTGEDLKKAGVAAEVVDAAWSTGTFGPKLMPPSRS